MVIVDDCNEVEGESATGAVGFVGGCCRIRVPVVVTVLVVVHVVTMVSTSFVTLVFFVCLQTVLLSTVSNCAKTISMYWNTTNSM